MRDGSTTPQISENTLTKNKIGTDPSGTSAVPNQYVGLAIGEYCVNNQIGDGGTGGTMGNQISGNDQNGPIFGIGLFLGSRRSDVLPEAMPHDNRIYSNVIGGSANPATPLSNNIGIVIVRPE